MYSNEPLSLLLPLYSDAGIRYNSEQPLCTSRKHFSSQALPVSKGWFLRPPPLFRLSSLFNTLTTTHLDNFYAPTFAYLRGVASSCGGMMTTRTVTVVLRRSIICSWVSVATATLQISTSRLPCRSPACQAYPYGSTCEKFHTGESLIAKSLAFGTIDYCHCWYQNR